MSKENLKSYAAYLVVFTVLWLCGYMDVSFAWIILSVGIVGVWEYRREARRNARGRNRVRMASITKEGNLPCWACITEGAGETVDWLNNALEQMWPYIEQMVRKVVKESVEPELQKKLPSSLKSLYFETIDLGRKSPYVTNVKTYSSKVYPDKRSEFIIDMDITYSGDAQFKFAVKRMHLGIAHLQLRGPLRIILKPLLSDYGVIGGITVFFRKRPQLSFDLTNLLNVLDFPGLKDTLRDIVDDAIASVAVLPNRIVVPLAGNVDVSELQYPMPEGVLQVEVIEARELIKSDVSLIGKGSSDPYAVVKIGAQSFRSAVKKNNLNPVWNETFEAFVDNCEGQDLDVAIRDKDISKDEILGSVEISIAGMVKEKGGDFWIPLEGVSQGQVHLRTSWFVLSESPLDLCPPEEHGSVAALFVKIIAAENLRIPAARVVFCRVTVGGERQQTFEAGGEHPEWNQLLRFLLKNPFSQVIQIDVVDAKNGSKLGRLICDTSPLIDETEMTVEGRYRLEDSGESSTLTCKFILRAFKATGVVAAASSRATAESGYRSATCDMVNGADEVDERDGGPANATEDEDYEESYSPSWSETSANTSSSNQTEKNEEEASPSGSLFCVTPQEDVTQPKGEVTISLAYSHRRNRLVVEIQRVTGLVLEVPTTKTKPYVRLYLLPDRSKKSLRKTYVYPGSKNPVFDETFEYAIGLDQLRERRLEVAVKNGNTAVLQARSGSKNVIGKTTVELSALNLTDGETLIREIRG